MGEEWDHLMEIQVSAGLVETDTFCKDDHWLKKDYR